MTAYLGVDTGVGTRLGTEARERDRPRRDAQDGTITDAGWARGSTAVTEWVADHLGPRTLVAVDASLVVTNATGIREAERQVGQRYGR